MQNRERGFLGKVAVFILTILAVVGLIAMSMSVLSVFINPKHFIWTTVFGLAFWEIFMLNVVVFILLLLLWSRKAWIAVLALLISLPGLSRSYALGSKKEASDSFRIMSYNVHLFGHIDKETDKERFAYQVMNMIREQQPDVVCMQEFYGFEPKISLEKCIRLFAETIECPYTYYNKMPNYGGNVIFSKYPITNVTEESGFGKGHKYGVMVEVDAGDRGKFHVANVHLLSYMITDNEIDILTNSNEWQQQLDTVGKTVLHKLKYAYQLRSDELQTVLDGMPPVFGPIIVCGDFNEPPLSYNNRQMQKAGFTDTFTKVGRGIKPTYAGKLPLLRIDYIWGNDQIMPLDFKRIRNKASDHYPVLLDFAIINN